LLKEFGDFKVYHLIGNHDLYNFNREALHSLLKTQPINNVGYYDFSPHPGWKIVILDSFDFCIIQPETREAALAYLKQFNPNDCESRKADWGKGLSGVNLRFLPYNGALSTAQLQWLNQTLEKATALKEKVIILGHVPICPGSCTPTTLLWNYDEVLKIIHSYRCVVACLAGHDHQGGYMRDDHGIHHKSFEAPLETPIGMDAYGVVHVYQNKLVLQGSGVVDSDTWNFE